MLIAKEDPQFEDKDTDVTIHCHMCTRNLRQQQKMQHFKENNNQNYLTYAMSCLVVCIFLFKTLYLLYKNS